MKKTTYIIAAALALSYAAPAQAVVGLAGDRTVDGGGSRNTTVNAMQYRVVDDLGGGGGGGYTGGGSGGSGGSGSSGGGSSSDRTIVDTPVFQGEYYVGEAFPSKATATVSSCPSGTTMSADKCCCVNN